jgi:hypothetical protein
VFVDEAEWDEALAVEILALPPSLRCLELVSFDPVCRGHRLELIPAAQRATMSAIVQRVLDLASRSLPFLTTLSVRSKRIPLTGVSLAALSTSPTLTHILWHGQLSVANVAHIGQIPHLRTMNVKEHGLPLPLALRSLLPTARANHHPRAPLVGMPLDDECAALLSTLPSLEELWTHDCMRVTDWSFLAHFPRFRILSLYPGPWAALSPYHGAAGGDRIADSLVRGLQGCTHLHSLALISMPLSTEQLRALCALDQLPHLTHLRFDRMPLPTLEPITSSRLHAQLHLLHIGSARNRDLRAEEQLPHLLHMTQLHTLELVYCFDEEECKLLLQTLQPPCALLPHLRSVVIHC